MKNKKPTKKELLSKRVFFTNDNIRNEFFGKLKTKFGNWTNLRKHFNIYKSKLDILRNGKVSIKYSTFLEFLEHFNEEDKIYFQQEITLKDKSWGRSKGGISTYQRHKHLFEKGRKIGAMQTRYHFSMSTPLTLGLCEFIGAFIGDGFTNKYGSNYVIQITGDADLDRNYYLTKLKPIIMELNPDSNPIITEKDNTLRLTVNSKEFHNLLTKRFKFPAGKKTHIVKIPEEIINAQNPKFINSCIRGIFDTDGCVFFDKRKSYKEYYIRINLTSVSSSLIKQVQHLLKKLNLNPRITSNYSRYLIQINGVKNCRKFVEKIGFSNNRHLIKVNHILGR